MSLELHITKLMFTASSSNPDFFPCRSSMEVLSGPWADLALLLRQAITQTDKETDSFLPLWLVGLLLFLSVCLLLLQLIIYLSWKLRQGRRVINFSCPALVIFTMVLCS